MQSSTESSSSSLSLLPSDVLEQWVETIVDRIVNSFSEEQMEAWEAGVMFIRAPVHIHTSMRLWALDAHDDKFEIPLEVDPNRGNGKTYYVACLYIIWCLRNPDTWVHLREHKYPPAHHDDMSLSIQVQALEYRYLASTPFALETRNGNMVRAVARRYKFWSGKDMT